MKVPTLVTTRTQAPSRTSQYSSLNADPRAFGAGIAQAGEQLGQSLQLAGKLSDQRTEKTDRFASLQKLNEFETKRKERLAELQRTAQPTGQGFRQMIEEDFDRDESEFLSTLPPDLQEEFSVRTSDLKQGQIGQALEYEYKAGDAFFRQGVSDIYEKSRAALDPRLGGNADNLAVEQAKVNEAIDASDLSEVEKAELKRKTAQGLEGVGYRSAVAKEAAEGPALSGSIGATVDAAADRYGVPRKVLRTLAWIESRGDPNAQNPDSSAGGLFQFIDSTAANYGLKDKFNADESADAGARLTANNMEGLRQVLGREPTVGEIYLAHQQGLGGATKLLRNPGARAVDVVGEKAVRSNGGSLDMTAGQFAQLWISKAENTPGGADLDSRFSNVPYEDRVALKEDAQRDVMAEATRLAQQQAAVYNTQLNSLLTGLHDGTAGKVEIDAFRARHPGMDFEDIKKADAAYKTFNEETGSAASTAEKIQNFGPLDPTDSANVKGLNNMVKSVGGFEQIAAGNPNFVNGYLSPLVSKAQDIPTDVVGQLTGMIRSSNQTQWAYALDSLAQLRDASPRAFDNRVPDAVQKDVDYWLARRNLVPHDELMKQMNPGLDQAERQARITLRKDAESYLGTKADGIPNLKTLVEAVKGDFGSSIPLIGADAQTSSVPWAAQYLEADFQPLFIDAYERYGNVEDATREATKSLQRTWAVTSIGEGRLMKNPPEKSGYKPYNGSYDWMNQEVLRENNLNPDTRFELISDDTTQQEFDAFKAGGRPPSYRIAVTDANGVVRMLPQRQFFEVPEEVRVQDAIRFDTQQSLGSLRQRMEELSSVVDAARNLGQVVDPADEEELFNLRQVYQDKRKIIAQRPDTYEEEFDAKTGEAAKSGAFIGGLFNAPN